jgi:hypothetical protein
MRPVRIVAICALIALAAPQVQAAGFTFMEGTWRGAGWTKPAAGSAREAVRCRINASVSENALRVDISGQCASPGKRVNVNGYVRREPDGRYTGRWSNPNGLGTIGLSGNGDESRISLSFMSEDADTGEEIAGTMIWEFSESRFAISGTVREIVSGKSWQASSITFEK